MVKIEFKTDSELSAPEIGRIVRCILFSISEDTRAGFTKGGIVKNGNKIGTWDINAEEG